MLIHVQHSHIVQYTLFYKNTLYESIVAEKSPKQGSAGFSQKDIEY